MLSFGLVEAEILSEIHHTEIFSKIMRVSKQPKAEWTKAEVEGGRRWERWEISSHTPT